MQQLHSLLVLDGIWNGLILLDPPMKQQHQADSKAKMIKNVGHVWICIYACSPQHDAACDKNLNVEKKHMVRIQLASIRINWRKHVQAGDCALRDFIDNTSEFLPAGRS